MSYDERKRNRRAEREDDDEEDQTNYMYLAKRLRESGLAEGRRG